MWDVHKLYSVTDNLLLADSETLDGRLLFAIPKKGDFKQDLIEMCDNTSQEDYMRSVWHYWLVRSLAMTSIVIHFPPQVRISSSDEIID